MKNFKKTTSNISAVIRSDYKRLSRSVVTVICVFGLALVPCLYAWFNIMSNWNPYTPDSTKNLKIAVASSDEGTDFVGLKLNVGELILDKLKANDQIDWQFPDSVQEVMDGLYAGDYYAGLIIPEDFSASMLGFTDGEMDQPEIIYYDNQKMNAVASRVTDRAQGIIRNEINSIFVATIVDELSNFTSVFNGMGLSAENALESLDNKLGSIKSDLKTYAAIMDSMSTVTKSAATVTSMTNDLLPDVTNMLVNSRYTRASSFVVIYGDVQLGTSLRFGGRCGDGGGSRGAHGGDGHILVQQDGLAGLNLYLVGTAVESHFVCHDYLTSLIEMKRSSFRGLPI